jgi:UDP-2,3-diacylglucosamine pyrophosphatase LpxH
MFVQIRGLSILMKLFFIIVLVFPHSLGADTGELIKYPETRFITLTDLHYFDPSLGTSGAAFQAYLAGDRKLLAEAEELLDATISEIIPIKADFIIISGDLTKDGERHNHLILADKLKELEQSGKKVFVVPGNHDIANSDAVKFVGDNEESIATVTAKEFANIYQKFGYDEALERDEQSLSYIAEPVPGLWLLAIDSCRWREHEPGEHSITGGIIYDETLSWIDSILAKAQKQNKKVIAFMHHGIMEHYPNNLKFYSDYVVENHETVSEKLANANVDLVFTGHFHAQDITQKRFEETGKTIFDIETGSLVTAPCPYRIIEITAGQKAVIESKFIASISSHPTGFQEFASNYVYEGTIVLADDKLKGYWVSKEDRDQINPQAAQAYRVHLAGDEVKPEMMVDDESVGLWGRFILFMQKDLVSGWYTDLPPKDNHLVIDLQ